MISILLAISLLFGSSSTQYQEPRTTTTATKWRVARIAPWYGYGFYGNRTACGQRLTRTLVGVAHRTLPCGTRVQMVWKGRSIITKVVDRGPWPKKSLYDDMPFDLTAGAAKALGCSCSNPYFTRHNVAYRILG